MRWELSIIPLIFVILVSGCVVPPAEEQPAYYLSERLPGELLAGDEVIIQDQPYIFQYTEDAAETEKVKVILKDSGGQGVSTTVDKNTPMLVNKTLPPGQPVPPPPRVVPVPVPVPLPPPINYTPPSTPNVTVPTPPNATTPPPPQPPNMTGPVCGNGIVETGEQCEPPNTTTCDSSCMTIVPVPTPAVCGNNIVEAGEMCEPPNTATCDSSCMTIIPSYPAHCYDSAWSGDESDFNCGGSCPTCPPVTPFCDDATNNPYYPPWSCSTMGGCWANSDCTTGNCDFSQAQPLPAIDPSTNATYTSYSQLRALTGQSWVIPYSGTCK